MRRTSRSVFCTATSSIRCAWCAFSFPLARSPSEPRSEVSGVRSSWLTIDTNSSLSRSITCCSLRSRMVTTRAVRPWNWIGRPRSRTGTWVPSRRRRTAS
jgi:hypothetical protein